MPNLRTPVSEPLRQVILAIDAKKWPGKTPIADVEPRRVPKRVFETLRATEVPSVLADATDQCRGKNVAALVGCVGENRRDLGGAKGLEHTLRYPPWLDISDRGLSGPLLRIDREYDLAEWFRDRRS